MEGEDPVGDGCGELALMGGDDDGAAGVAEAGEQLNHLAGALDVHVGEGLIEEKELGDGEEDTGEGGALSHALRVLAEGACEVGIEANLAEGICGGEAVAAGVEAAEVAEVFQGGELVIEHGCVAHVADAGAGVVGLEIAEDSDIAVAGAEEAGEDAEKGGLAGAVFTNEDVTAAGVELDRDLAQCGKGAEELGDFLDAGANLRSFASGGGGAHSQAAGFATRAAAAVALGAAAGFAGSPGWSGLLGAYLLAHLACSPVA